jgi:uncharacterized membrane protein
MIKKHSKALVLTSLLILLPIIAGVILWDKLPDSVPIHFGPNGEPDDYAGRGVAVFVMPLVMLGVHWMCMLGTAADPKNKDIDSKPLGLVLWVCPLVSLLVNGIIYVTALGIAINIPMIFGLFFGCLFVVIGNYLPKCRRNYTIGIKLPWTLEDEDNWNRTHRFAGRLWTVGGLLTIIAAFIGAAFIFVFFGLILLMSIIPTIYSYLLYKKTK